MKEIYIVNDHDTLIFRCKYCKFVALSRAGLTMHINRKHKNHNGTDVKNANISDGIL